MGLFFLRAATKKKKTLAPLSGRNALCVQVRGRSWILIWILSAASTTLDSASILDKMTTRVSYSVTGANGPLEPIRARSE